MKGIVIIIMILCELNIIRLCFKYLKPNETN